MTAATNDRDTQEVRGLSRAFPLEASTLIYSGTMVAVNAAGNLVRGATGAALKCVGVVQRRYDNTGGAAGNLTGEVKAGVFGPFANSAGGDLVGNGDVGTDCFMADDQTVAKTSATNTRSVAGRVWQVDAAGVWVKFW